MDATWWQRGLIYQIYPRSFMDSNGDGTGDLAGIISRLDYLVWLGVDAIWISPIFPSPMADFGYDVADYTDIDPRFGNLADFDRLLAEAHARGLRVVLDYVPNHTSDQHPWFLESRSSRDNPRRDWYLWRDAAAGGGPPNNWLGSFGGPAWEWDPATGQYYYHAYLKEQPDLNWRTPAVEKAMLDVMRFWLDRGVDGFRIDALRQVIKDDQFRDNPPNPDWTPDQNPYQRLRPVYSADRPELMEVVYRMRAVADAYPERVLIGELWLPIARLVAYYGQGGRGLHLPFNFHLILIGWNASAVSALIDTYEAALPAGAWPNWVLGNHDRARVASRVGTAQARVAAMLLLTLRGTPTLYNGDEIGLRDVPIPPELVQDPFEKNVPGLGVGRDPERTPMQWDASPPAAGFSTTTPWLPVADDYAQVNVAAQRENPRSMLSLHRELIRLRRASMALARGTYRQIASDEQVLVYARELDGERYAVALNFTDVARTIAWADGGGVILSTHLDRDEALDEALELRADEGVVIRF